MNEQSDISVTIHEDRVSEQVSQQLSELKNEAQKLYETQINLAKRLKRSERVLSYFNGFLDLTAIGSIAGTVYAEYIPGYVTMGIQVINGAVTQAPSYFKYTKRAERALTMSSKLHSILKKINIRLRDSMLTGEVCDTLSDELELIKKEIILPSK